MSTSTSSLKAGQAGPGEPQDEGEAAPGHSKLEASFGHVKVAPRQNSLDMKGVWRHHQKADEVNPNELDFDYDLTSKDYPLSSLASLQDLFPSVLYNHHLSNLSNFSQESKIKCFDWMENGAGMLVLAGPNFGEAETDCPLDWIDLDDIGLQHLLEV